MESSKKSARMAIVKNRLKSSKAHPLRQNLLNLREIITAGATRRPRPLGGGGGRAYFTTTLVARPLATTM